MPSSRRQFILSGLSGLISTAAFGFGESSQFDIAELMIGDSTLSRPNAWARALFLVTSATSIESNARVVQIAPEDPELFQHPFAVLSGSKALPPLNEATALALQRFVQSGGFLFVDDASGIPDGEFYRSFVSWTRRLFPTRPLAPLGEDHSIFRAYFLLDKPLGRLDAKPYLEGVTLGHTTPIVYCHNDLSGALDRSETGQNRYPVVPGGENQRRESYKLAINLVMYSLTSNYKHDQAHVAELIREGRL